MRRVPQFWGFLALSSNPHKSSPDNSKIFIRTPLCWLASPWKRGLFPPKKGDYFLLLLLFLCLQEEKWAFARSTSLNCLEKLLCESSLWNCHHHPRRQERKKKVPDQIAFWFSRNLNLCTFVRVRKIYSFSPEIQIDARIPLWSLFMVGKYHKQYKPLLMQSDPVNGRSFEDAYLGNEIFGLLSCQ